uniref:Uncharacterized protein n=1 Tax=Oryza sativa subsp. japonica TaxID=39947 RepID=Q652V7_ORYSJ|nr:hypothetical protein [Oryza sativa Japonica Group]
MPYIILLSMGYTATTIFVEYEDRQCQDIREIEVKETREKKSYKFGSLIDSIIFFLEYELGEIGGIRPGTRGLLANRNRHRRVAGCRISSLTLPRQPPPYLSAPCREEKKNRKG